MTNKIATVTASRRTPRLVAIWNEIRHGQARFEQVNRPWIADVRRIPNI